jgi:hypothetical protein
MDCRYTMTLRTASNMSITIHLMISFFRLLQYWNDECPVQFNVALQGAIG